MSGIGGGLETDASSVPSIDHLTFRPPTRWIIVSMLLIAAIVLLAAMLEASRPVMFVVIGASCFFAGAASVIHSFRRWENAYRAYLKEKSSADNWNVRFLKLQSESTRTNTVLSHMTDGVLMLSPTLEIVLINDAARELLSLPSGGDYLGRKFPELVRLPQIVSAVERTRSGSTGHSITVDIINGTSVRPVAVRVGQIQDTVPPQLLLVLRDETESTRVEATRREFIANVSHELKTPLAAIKGYSETVELAIEDDTEAAKYFIGQIDHQCKRLEELISDMMRLARAQSGAGTLQIQSLDLNDVIEQSLVSLAPVAAAKQIELAVQACQGPVLVMADNEAVVTITQNLISNAIRHTQTGGHVTVACRREDSGWIMAVRDDGVGIAKEFQERIFERFYRVDRTLKTNDGGTGIGLSIVKHLTRALRGTVRVISSPGEGATFEVWLPGPD